VRFFVHTLFYFEGFTAVFAFIIVERHTVHYTIFVWGEEEEKRLKAEEGR
jgi:hypothetical protein